MCKNKSKLAKVGDVFTNNRGHDATITSYKNTDEVRIKFINTGYSAYYSVKNIVCGRFKDKLEPIVKGVGFVGDGIYTYTKDTKAYDIWSGMLSRCYCKKYQEKKPTYKGCRVAPEWHNFQIFAKWFYEHYKEGYHLDKDILFQGNKTYSRSTCVFVPLEINSLYTASDAMRGLYPQGVSEVSGSSTYTARLSVSNVRKRLGNFKTPEEAYYVYKQAKELWVKEVANRHYISGNITQRTKDAMFKYKLPMLEADSYNNEVSV